MENTDSEVILPLNLYEIAYLLSPLVPAENASTEFNSAIRLPLENLGGIFASELTPILRPLAYPVTKVIGSNHQKYNDAYFGATRFELSTQAILALKDMLDKNEQILRFMIIRLPKNADKAINPIYRKILAPIRRENNDSPKGEITEVHEAIDEVELDKEIEELLEDKVIV